MSFRSNNDHGDVRPFPGRSTPAAFSPALRPVLIVLHQETSTPGRVGNALRALGYPLDIRRPRKRWSGIPAPSSSAAR
jgi:GMP synthase (glutamine-hydrolysing)